MTIKELRQIIKEEVAKINEANPLAAKWQQNNKKGFRLKDGDIELVSGGMGAEHTILKKGKKIGTFGYDSNADDCVGKANGKSFNANEIDDIFKKLK